MKYWLRFSITVFVFIYIIVSCKDNHVYKEFDYNSVASVIADNYNLSIFSAAIVRTGISEDLQIGKGPYTVIVPSNDAFKEASISSPTQLRKLPVAWIFTLANYHVLNGRFEMDKFPFLINQEVSTHGGKKIFISRWVKNQDTIVTINGANIVLHDRKASNGVIQITNRVLEPYQNDIVADAVSSVNEITLFTEALRRSGLFEKLKGKGPFTVFAPSNKAMQNAGFKSMQQVKETERPKLIELCSYHIAEDLRFINDYILATGSSNIGNQRMINTFNVSIHLIPKSNAPGVFEGIQIIAPGNLAPINITRRDILAGNGIVHVIDGVLKITR